MTIIAWIVLGAVAGLIAEKLTGSRTGIVIATVVGIVGALLGGFLAKALLHIDTLGSFFDVRTWLTAIVGAVILLALNHALNGRSHRRRSRV